jgi:hypothetical protein
MRDAGPARCSVTACRQSWRASNTLPAHSHTAELAGQGLELLLPSATLRSLMMKPQNQGPADARPSDEAARCGFISPVCPASGRASARP